MTHINRREFLKTSAAGTLAAGLALGAVTHAESAPLTATTSRALGKTGLTCSLLGMGTGTKAGGGSSGQNREGREAFVNCLEHAYDRGITYFDMADSYGAHDYMKDALKRSVKRDKVMLLTKTGSREPDALRADVDRFLKELDTDYIDIILMHCFQESDWDVRYRAAMDVLSEAKAQGKVKAIGCSNHDFGALKTAASSDWVDVILARINPYGVKMDASPEEVVPVLKQAHDSGKAILGMKIAGEGELVAKLPESLKFALSLGCIDAMTIGFIRPAEVDDTIEKLNSIRLA